MQCTIVVSSISMFFADRGNTFRDPAREWHCFVWTSVLWNPVMMQSYPRPESVICIWFVYFVGLIQHGMACRTDPALTWANLKFPTLIFCVTTYSCSWSHSSNTHFLFATVLPWKPTAIQRLSPTHTRYGSPSASFLFLPCCNVLPVKRKVLSAADGAVVWASAMSTKHCLDLSVMFLSYDNLMNVSPWSSPPFTLCSPIQ